jgi:hypothetical protein
MNKRFKIIGLFIIGVGIFFSFYAGPKIYRKYKTHKVNQEWRVNFPQTLNSVEKLPNPDSLYVFIMAGQSNMAGRGFVEPHDTIPNKRILTIDKSMNWIYAKEPLHFYEPSMTGLDCGTSFAKNILDSLPNSVFVAIIPCAVGGSSIDQWLHNNDHRGVKLMDNFENKVKSAEKYGKIKGIIWHQGESDAKPELISNYSQKLDSLITIFREISKNDSLPIILGQLGRFANPKEQIIKDSINMIINSFSTRNNISVVVTKDLKDRGDKLHFDSESQRKLGIRYAEKYIEMTMPAHNNVYKK